MASDRAGPRRAAVLEPPGLLGLNYGAETPTVAIVSHLAFGIALGLLLAAAADMPDAALRPIGDYGLIGDTRTAALVSSDGSIDWMCAPHFDGDPMFGRLVGGPTAGTFRVGPVGCQPARSAVDTGPAPRRSRPPGSRMARRCTLTEGMVAELGGRLLPTTLLVRRLTADGGPVDVTIEFDPRLGDGHRGSARRRATRSGLVCSWGSLAVALDAMPTVDRRNRGRTRCR